MKRRTTLLMSLVLLGLMFSSVTADAGWRDRKDRDKREKARRERVENTPRYDNYPTMGFFAGELRQGGFAEWTLDEAGIYLTKDCNVVDEEGNDADLMSGRQALIMGPRIGDTIVAWSIRIMKPEWDQPSSRGSDVDITWSEVDPTVGVGTGPE